MYSIQNMRVLYEYCTYTYSTVVQYTSTQYEYSTNEVFSKRQEEKVRIP